MPEITHEIKKHFGVLSENPRGWRKEVNLVSWNDRDPKIEIREWSEDYSKLGKGTTFLVEEVEKLKEILNSIDLKKVPKSS